MVHGYQAHSHDDGDVDDDDKVLGPVVGPVAWVEHVRRVWASMPTLFMGITLLSAFTRFYIVRF